MRSLSSIIKSQRIARETIINLGITQMPKVLVEEETIDKEVCEKEREALLKQAKLEAAQILAEAQDDAKRIIEQANQQVSQMHLDSEKICLELQEEVKLKVASIQEDAKRESENLINEAYHEKEAILRGVEPEIVNLVQQLVSHIVQEELVAHTEWIMLLLKKARQKEHIRERVELIINPTLAQRLSEKEREAIQSFGEGVTLNIDESLNDTSCAIKTSHGSMVYDVKQGLEKVLKELSILQSL